LGINKSLVGVSPIYSEIESYAAELEKRVLRMQKLLESCPEGTLWIGSSHGKPEYFRRSGSNGNYTYEHHKKDSPESKALGDKKIAQDRLRIIEQNLKACKSFLKQHASIEDNTYANSLVNIKAVPHSKRAFLSDSDKAEKWLDKNPGNQNGIEIDKPIITLSGNTVRSKAEGIIDDALYKYWGELVYRYEPVLYLQNSKRDVRPDFLIYLPKIGKEIVWEHFGLMDDPYYASEKCKLIRNYQSEGYVLGDTLICTFESSSYPISSGYIEYIVKTHILKY